MKRRLIALVLVVSLVASMCTTAFAGQYQEGPGEINYVSLGDSMANGYCFEGYEQGKWDGVYLRTYNFINGENVYGEGSYALQFEDYLTELGYDVNHTKLAPSAMRAEDLLYLLGGREEPIDGWYDQVRNYTGVYDDGKLSAHYQDAIVDADIITMGVGNASFGAFMLQEVTNAIGVMGGAPDPDPNLTLENGLSLLESEEAKQIILNIYDEMAALVVPYAEVVPFDVESILGIVAYTAANFILNYEASVEKILELNEKDELEIILVGLMNTTYGMVITGESFEFPFGDMMDTAFNGLNAYMAGLPAAKQLMGEWEDATFYYADQPTPDFIVLAFDDLAEAGWENIQGGRLSGDTVRDRQITAYNEGLRDQIGVAMGFALPAITLKDVQEYVLDGDYTSGVSRWMEEYFNLSDKEQAKYSGKGFENYGPYAPAIEYDINKQISVSIYLAIEEAIVLSVDTLEITLDGMMGISSGKIFEALGEMPEELSQNPTPIEIKNALVGWFTGSETGRAMCKVYALFKVGNGMSVHPTPVGHDNIFEAVVEAYETNYTAADETEKNLIIVAEILADLVAEYYDEAYAYAYAEAKAAGYIDTAIAGIDSAIAELTGIDLSDAQMTDAFKAELAGEVEEVIETLAAAKALILEADALDQASLDALMAMLDEAGEAIENIKNLLKQAGVDVNDLVIVPALEKAYSELTNVVIPALKAAAEEIAVNTYNYLVALAEQAGEDLAEAYDAFVEAFIEFLPEADAWLYDWFYNNPDKVIAFFEENGEFFVENAEAAAAVLGYIAYTFGPDVLEWVMENPEEVLEQFVSWYEKYGERTWSMILVYLEELGVIDAAEDLYGCIEDALADLYEQLEDCTDEAYAEMLKQIAVLRAQLDALRAEIEATANEQLMKLFAQIEKQLDMLEAMIKGEIEATIEEIKAQIAALEKSLDELVKAVIAETEAAVQKAILTAVEAIKEQLSYIDGAAEWLEEAVAEAYEAFVDALIEALPYIDEALYDFFYNNPDKVIAFFEENGEFFAENADAALAVLGYIAYTFGPDVLEWVMENPDEALEQFVAWYEQYGERTWAMILVYLEELGVLECLPSEEDVKAAIEAIEKQIEECYKQLENATGEALEELEATIEELKAAVEELNAMVEGYAQMLDAAVCAQLEAAIEELEKAVAELEKAVQELNAAVEAQIAQAKAAVQEALAKVEAAIAKVEAAVNGVIADVNEAIEELYAALEKAQEELANGAAQIVENLKDALADLYDVIVENAEKIDAAVLSEIYAAIEDVEAALAKLEAVIKGAADATIEDVAAELKSALAELQDAVEALIEAVEDNSDAIVKEATAAFEQAYLDATTDKYTISKDSYYVAIGDETVLAEPSYADMLAEALEVEYTKIGEEGLTVAGTEAVLMENIAEIVKADLITLGYSNNTMISFMIDQATSMMPEELDWSVYGDEELGVYVDAALAEIAETLYAQGLDEKTAGLMLTAIESYAYAYTGYMVGYPMVVEAIREINPEALIIMVGMNNALADVTLEAEGVEIELGEYVQYLVDAANIEALSYAMLTGNAIYVDAPEVETLLEEYEIELGSDLFTVLQLLGFPQNRALLNPSEDGYDYIKEQILSVLELDYKFLLGDVNLDGVVNAADTTMVYRYVLGINTDFSELQMLAADANEDGVVNSADTTMIYLYVLGTIPALGAK